jgi:hypothetical protein
MRLAEMDEVVARGRRLSGRLDEVEALVQAQVVMAVLAGTVAAR